VLVVGPAGPTTNTARRLPQYEVKPEAATAVIELLMMGGKMTKTCYAVNKRQDNKLKICFIWFVIYLNCTMMHRLTNLKCPDLASSDCQLLVSLPKDIFGRPESEK
jgi:hypothetical protein